MIAPISDDMEMSPMEDIEKLYGGPVNTRAKTLPTTMSQEVVRP